MLIQQIIKFHTQITLFLKTSTYRIYHSRYYSETDPNVELLSKAGSYCSKLGSSVMDQKGILSFTVLPFVFSHDESIKENLQLCKRCTGIPGVWSSCPETVHTGRVCKWQAEPEPGLQASDFRQSWWDDAAYQLSPSACSASLVSLIPAERCKAENISHWYN